MRIIIAGQGICGTWLSFWLRQMGVAVLVIDNGNPLAASRVASGVINPVTGRRAVLTWKAETLLPFANNAYQQMGQILQKELITNCGILAFPPAEDMHEAYQKRIAEEYDFIHPVANSDWWKLHFNTMFPAVQILPAYCVDLATMLSCWRQLLCNEGRLLETVADLATLQFTQHHVLWGNEKADYFICCDGIAGFQLEAWCKLPYVRNKGEAIIADIPNLPTGKMYKFGSTSIVPWQHNLWWVGSSYENEFETTEPTTAFHQRMQRFLTNTLKHSFTIIDHLAAIRPASVERRPFIGMHPTLPRLGICNGMGTKGVSLAPYYTQQLAAHLVHGTAIDPEVSVHRFTRAFMH